VFFALPLGEAVLAIWLPWLRDIFQRRIGKLYRTLGLLLWPSDSIRAHHGCAVEWLSLCETSDTEPMCLFLPSFKQAPAGYEHRRAPNQKPNIPVNPL